MLADVLSPKFAALADPTRRAIVVRLAQGEATVTELTAPLSISMPAVSRHLKVLEQSGLIERGREAQFRPCRLRPEGLRALRSWLDEVRAVWDQRLDRLETYLAEIQAAEAAGAPAPASDADSPLPRSPEPQPPHLDEVDHED